MEEINNISYETCLCILRNPKISNDVKIYQLFDMIEQGLISVKKALFLAHKYKIIFNSYKDIETEHNTQYSKYFNMLDKTSRTCQRCGEKKPHTLDIDRNDVPYNILCEDCWVEYMNNNDLY